MHGTLESRRSIGANNPPSHLELCQDTIASLGEFLKANPVIATEAEAKAAKLEHDRATIACRELETERTAKVKPLNEQVAAINGPYKAVHNTDKKNPGILDRIIDQLKLRLTGYAKAEERKRQAAAAEAARKLEEAERIAREAEAKEREAQQDAAQGVCDVDIAAATQQADAAFAQFKKADREAARADKNTKVRLTGGFGNAIGLRTQETLSVTDHEAAVKEMGLTDDIREAIIKSARAYRKVFGELPEGVTATQERGI